MFRFEIDPAHKLVRSWIDGFLTIDEVMEWSRQEQAAVVTLGCKSREFLLLVDTSRCAIQSQDVVTLFQQLITKSKYKARRIAIMRGGSLIKMQSRRIAAGADYVQLFDETADAERWLFTEEPAQIAMPAFAAATR